MTTNIWLAWSSHLSTHLTVGVAPNILVGEVGVEPTKPEAMRLQRTPVSDLVLSQLNGTG